MRTKITTSKVFVGGRTLRGIGDELDPVTERALNHKLLPAPALSVPLKPLAKVQNLDEAMRYAVSGFHVCVDKGLAASGATRANWGAAATSYYDAASAIRTEQAILAAARAAAIVNPAAAAGELAEEPAFLAKAKAALTSAGQLASVARGGGSSATSASLLKPMTGQTPDKMQIKSAGLGGSSKWLIAAAAAALTWWMVFGFTDKPGYKQLGLA